MQHILEISELSYRYPTQEKRVLHEVSARLESGKNTLLLGKSGAGKSTLAYILAGLLRAEAQPLLDGCPVAIGDVGLVFQHAQGQLFSSSIKEELSFGPKNFGMDDKQALEAAHHALKLVGLDPERYLERSPFSLSGGEAKRVAIASILSFKPTCLIFDEPSAGLDVPSQMNFVRLINSLKAQGYIILIISHDLELFLPEADRVWELREGSLEQFISAQEFVKAQLSVGRKEGLPDLIALQAELERLSGIKAPYSFSLRAVEDYIDEVRRHA